MQITPRKRNFDTIFFEGLLDESTPGVNEVHDCGNTFAQFVSKNQKFGSFFHSYCFSIPSDRIA